MVSRNKIVKTVIILLLLSVLLSGCTEKKIITAPDSNKKDAVDVSSQNLNKSPKEENIPEISIASFSSIYMHDNLEQKDIYLFSWENVPGNESNRLLNFLRDYYQINLVENVNIIKDEERKIIRVFSDKHLIDIMLFNESAQINLGNGGSVNLVIKEENGTHNFYDTGQKYQNKYDISPVNYAAYNLSIKNNGSNPIDFKLNDLRLHEGDRIFNTTTLEHYDGPSQIEVLHDLENENKLQDTTLLPGQTLNGIVTFRVNSLYNKSFLLKFNTITITSASFEKSIEALKIAEGFNYATALGIPPYANCRQRGVTGSYVPFFDDRCYTWANWMNRSIFETFQKSDVERMQKLPPDNIPPIEMVYALRVIPERNITMYPVTTKEFSSNLVVIDDTGEEMINTSRIAGMAVMSNLTYIFRSGSKLNFPGMNFSNASVVRISFYVSSTYFGGLSINNQDVILDDKLNIIVVRNYPDQYSI